MIIVNFPKSKGNDLLVNSHHFFNEVDFPDNIDEYFIFSRYHIKYIANTIVNYSEGSASIIEYSRCENVIDSLFSKLGYTEYSKIVKKGEIFRYKNFPIIILNLAYIDISPTESIRDENKISDVVEILCYCKETEKDFYWPILKEIKSRLSR